MFPLLVGLAVLFAGGVADFLAENQGPLSQDKFFAGSLGAAIFLGLSPFFESLIVSREGPRARVDLWRSVQCAAVLLSAATWLQLNALFNRPTYLAGVSSRWEQLEPEHMIVPAGAMIAAFVVRRRSVPSHLPLRAALSGLLALVVLIGAQVRVDRAAPPWELLDNLPLVMNLPPLDRAVGTSVTLHQGDNLWVRRFWSREYPNYCDVVAARSERELIASIAPDHMVPVGCGALTLRALPATNEYVIVSPREAYRSAFVLDGDTLTRRSVGRARMGDYPERIAPPRGWVKLSWAVLALSVLALLPRRRSARWRAQRALWREATLDRDGVIRFDDGASATLSYRASIAPGPVVVLAPAAPRAEGGPFRNAPQGLTLAHDDVRAGTVASVQAALDAQRDAAWVRLTATAWLAIAPLAPYALRGMLF